MLKIYDEHTDEQYFLYVEDDKKYVKHTYDGYDILCFEISTYNDLYSKIKEEVIVDDGRNKYIIKHIDEHSDFVVIECDLELDDWRIVHTSFKKENVTIGEAIEEILPQDWTLYGDELYEDKHNVQGENGSYLKAVTSLEILEVIREIWGCMFTFNALTKDLTILNIEEYEVTDEYFAEDINLKSIGYVGDTREFATRIYPYGVRDEDDLNPLTIASVNEGLEYLDDNTFSDKIISVGWSDERYKDAASLKQAALLKLSKLAVPNISYSCEVSFLRHKIYMYQVVTLIDRRRQAKINYRIVEWNEYEDSTLDSIVLSSTGKNIESILDKLNEEQDKLNAERQDLENKVEKYNVVLTERLVADEAEIRGKITAAEVDAKLAQFEEAVIGLAYIKKAEIISATIGSLSFNTAEGILADIKALIANTINSEYIGAHSIQAYLLQSEIAFITDALVRSLSASKLTAGNIDTNSITIQSADKESTGKFQIIGETLQVSDGTRIRVQLGKDANGNYGVYVLDASGNLIFDSTNGLKAQGIKSPIIVDAMVSENANINGSKIDIESLISEINDDTGEELIKASKIIIDRTEQDLEVEFSEMSTTLDNTVESIGSGFSKQHTIASAITSNTESIETLVADTTIEVTEQGQTRTEKLKDYTTALKQTTDGLGVTVLQLQTAISTKANVFYQDTPPTGSSVHENDIWIDSSSANKQNYIRKNGQWIPYGEAGKIGGRNLLLAPSDDTSVGSSLQERQATWTGYTKYSQYELTINDWTPYIGETIIARCYMTNINQISGTGSGIQLSIEFTDGSTSVSIVGGKDGNEGQWLENGESGWVSLHFAIPDPSQRTSPTTISRIRFALRHSGASDVGTVSYRYAKVEIGTQPTDWTLAPEDQNSINNQVYTNQQNLATLQINADSINASVEEMRTNINHSLDDVNSSIDNVAKSVSTKISSEDVEIIISEALSNGVDKVETKTGYLFDDNGLSINKTGSQMSTNVNEDGMRVYRDNTEVLTADNIGVNAINLTARQYLIVGVNSRFEDYDNNQRTGCFWIGG